MSSRERRARMRAARLPPAQPAQLTQLAHRVWRTRCGAPSVAHPTSNYNHTCIMRMTITGTLEANVFYQGLVKWFNVSSGYGFITCDTLGDVFVHAQACPEGFLYSGESVGFHVESSTRTEGIQAASVTRLRHSRAHPAVVSLIIQTPTFVC